MCAYVLRYIYIYIDASRLFSSRRKPNDNPEDRRDESHFYIYMGSEVCEEHYIYIYTWAGNPERLTFAIVNGTFLLGNSLIFLSWERALSVCACCSRVRVLRLIPRTRGGAIGVISHRSGAPRDYEESFGFGAINIPLINRTTLTFE